MKPILYQFPISHYCEKARWALEHRNIDYEIKNLIPGPHITTLKKIAPQSHTPVLQCEGNTIQGSEKIIDYLEARHKHPPLTPTNAEAASMAHEWSRFADRNIGVPQRKQNSHCEARSTTLNRESKVGVILLKTPSAEPISQSTPF